MASSRMLELAARKRIHEEEARRIEEEMSRETPSSNIKPTGPNTINMVSTGLRSEKRHALFNDSSDEEGPPTK